jgi:tellurite resistance protein TerC
MGTPTAWVAFNACVVVLFALDLLVINRRAEGMSLRKAAGWSALCVALSLGFDIWIRQTRGTGPALEFLTGYLVEQSLSLDNVLIFLLVFRAFNIATRLQHRVLSLGLLGALVLRGIMIGLGAALLVHFSWILYIFGGFLVLVGARMMFRRSQPQFRPEQNRIVQWARRFFPISESRSGQEFFVRERGRLVFTPLFLALVVIEGADVLFAVDSIPAVFGITRDAFLVYTSNICAIIGMRSFYFLIGGALPYFRYLDEGLSAVLIFIGAKMLAEPWIHVPTYVSLAVVAALLGLAMAASVVAGRQAKREDSPAP